MFKSNQTLHLSDLAKLFSFLSRCLSWVPVTGLHCINHMFKIFALFKSPAKCDAGWKYPLAKSGADMCQPCSPPPLNKAAFPTVPQEHWCIYGGAFKTQAPPAMPQSPPPGEASPPSLPATYHHCQL